MIELSILVPTIPQRFEPFVTLYTKLAQQARSHEVEVLAFTDNCQRSIGLKRQGLLVLSTGRYVCFVDDDDDVAPGYVTAIMAAIQRNHEADVIVFPTQCIFSKGQRAVVNHSIHNENEAAHPGSFNRKPWHVHPIHRDIALRSTFSDRMWGEDRDYLRGIWPILRTESSAAVDPLYIYYAGNKSYE